MTPTVAELVELLRAAAAPAPPPEYCLLWINHWSTCMQKSEWANVASAIGTVLAAVIALWFGLKALRQSAKDARTRAGLCAASITQRLSHTASVVSQCVATAVFNDLTVDVNTSKYQVIVSISKSLNADTVVLNQETLLGLTPLPNNCASRIAAALDILNHIRARADKFANAIYGVHASAPLERTAELAHWRAFLLTADDLLTVALREVYTASGTAAPRPSGEERHGTPSA